MRTFLVYRGHRHGFREVVSDDFVRVRLYHFGERIDICGLHPIPELAAGEACGGPHYGLEHTSSTDATDHITKGIAFNSCLRAIPADPIVFLI